MASSLANIPPLPGMRGGGGGSLGRGLGSLAPLGRPSLPSTLPSSLDSLPIGGALSAANPLNKPKLGAPASLTSTAHSTAGSAVAAAGSPRVQAVKFAVRFDPPTLALEYRDRKYPHRARNRCRVFELATLFPNDTRQIEDSEGVAARAQADRVARGLAGQFPQYLSSSCVSQAQLTRLVRKALSRPHAHAYSHAHVHPSMTHADASAEADADAEEQSMVEEELEDSLSHSHASYSHSFVDDAGHDAPYAAQPAVHHAQSAAFHIPGSEPDPDEDDLNHVSEAELQRRKEEMNEVFEQSLLRPGDPGYVYDKQVEFEATEESEWD